MARATELLLRATGPLRPEGRPLYAGLFGLPGDPVGDMWRLTDLLREYRGDAHTAAWTSAGLDATEIGLLSELYWGCRCTGLRAPRAWTDDQLDAAEDRLAGRGLIAEALAAPGRHNVCMSGRRSDRPAVRGGGADAGDDFDELLALLEPWGKAIREAGGYLPQGPHDLAPRSRPV